MKVWTIRGLLFAAAIAVVAQQPPALPLRGVNAKIARGETADWDKEEVDPKTIKVRTRSSPRFRSRWRM